MKADESLKSRTRSNAKSHVLSLRLLPAYLLKKKSTKVDSKTRLRYINALIPLAFVIREKY